MSRYTNVVMPSGAMTTRGQKRRRGARDLWDVIVNNDDISFKHILPRLNRTDVKFLYLVNTETRKLIKRSSRKGELKEMFKVKEMSAISTLEFAWELYPWGKLVKYEDERMDGSWFCSQVASSCSSGRERRKSVDGMERRLMRLQTKVIWKL